MSEKETCYVCRRVIDKEEAVRKVEQQMTAITVHTDCLRLFGELVRLSLQSTEPTISPPSQPAFTALPTLDKRTDSEQEAMMKVLQWAAKHQPERGMTPNEIDAMFREHYRWELSNASARLGELLEKGRIRRIREGKLYRYHSVDKKQ